MSAERETSIRWTAPGRPIHLVRNVCDGCAVWCNLDGERKVDHYREGACNDPEDTTCEPCLDAARAYGERVKARMHELRVEAARERGERR